VTKGIERMSRGKFAMLSYHGDKATVTVISTGKVSKHLEGMLKKAMEEIEKTYKANLANFYSSDQIPAKEVEKIVRKHLPLGLLDAMTFDSKKYSKVRETFTKEQRAVLNDLKVIDSDLPAPFKVFFLHSLKSKLVKRHPDPDLLYQCIMLAYQKGVLKNLTSDQVAEVGRQAKDTAPSAKPGTPEVAALRKIKVLPKAPKRKTKAKKLPSPPSRKK